MRCEEINGLISDYSVGNLARGMERLVREHIKECGSCRKELEQLDLIMAAVEENMGELEPPVGLWNGVRNRVSVDERQSVIDRARNVLLRPRRTLSLGIGAAALAAALFFGVNTIGPSPTAYTPNATAIEYIQGHAFAAGDDVFADRISLGFVVSMPAEETGEPL